MRLLNQSCSRDTTLSEKPSIGGKQISLFV